MRRVLLPQRCNPAQRLALALTLGLAAGPAAAAPGGPIGTLPLGHYQCELPGDAMGLAGIPQPEADFTITFGSNYRVGSRKGTYLLTGDRLAFTAGPLKGVMFQRGGNTFLRRIEPDGSLSRLRCVRQGGVTR